jgi:hypothetical protein
MQVVAALWLGAWRETAAHRGAAASGSVTGFASLWCLWAASTWLLLEPAGFPHAAGWQWQHRLLLVIVGVAYAFSSGWVVGRTHRAHRTAAVCGFAVSTIGISALELVLLYWVAPTVFVKTVLPLLPMLIALTVFAPVPIMFGGFWFPARQQPQSAR